LREKNFGGFEDEVYVVLYKKFGSDSKVDLRVNFMKVCEIFYKCD